MAATKMIALELDRVEATITRLDSTLEVFKKAFTDYFGCSTWYSYLQEQALMLRAHEAETQLDKIREPLDSLRARLAQSVTNIDAVVAASGKEASAKQMMVKAEQMMINAGKKMEAADRKEKEAGMLFGEINGLMKAAQMINADTQSRINTAVGLQDQADVALLTLQQNALSDEHSKAIETLREVFVLQKLQKMNMQVGINKRFEGNRVQTLDLEGDYTTQLIKNNSVIREILINKWNENHQSISKGASH